VRQLVSGRGGAALATRLPPGDYVVRYRVAGEHSRSVPEDPSVRETALTVAEGEGAVTVELR
jgi:hypothetical protein